jgi:hypothetical protein
MLKGESSQLTLFDQETLKAEAFVAVLATT